MAISQYGNEYYGLSGDDKPIGTPLNGRKFTEMDTSKEYRFDAENQQWLQQNPGGGSSTLSGLTDVDISNPANGQTLVYNAESGKWENGAGGGDGLLVTVNEFNSGTPSAYEQMDKTGGEIMASLSKGRNVVFQMPVKDGPNGAFNVGILSSYGSYIPEGMTDYTYAFYVLSNNNGFVAGSYTCSGADSYPVYTPDK